MKEIKVVYMADEDLKLNDLSRFSKSSRRLVLREYSNCEVPAGCGGVVFRWKKPDNPVAFEMLLFIPGKFELLIDGNPPQSACPFLERGEHVLSLIISNFKSSYGLLLFAGKTGETGFCYKEIEFYEGDKRERVLSLPDSSWKYLLSPPTDELWTELKFDDSSWKSMISKVLPPIAEQDSRQYQIRSLSELGAQSLGIEEAAEKVIWIRKKFSL
jgi:hypothetical protein